MSELRRAIPSKSKGDAHFKAIVVGDSGVGKSCIVTQFINEKFSPSFITTIGIDFKQKSINYDGKNIVIQLWDTAGQERFRAITTSYYRGSDGILFIYDVTDRSSFDAIDGWIKDAESRMTQNFIKILVANKIDNTRHRVVSNAEGTMLAKKYKIPYFECSAKTGENIDDIFNKFCELAAPTFFVSPTHKIDELDISNKKKCC